MLKYALYWEKWRGLVTEGQVQALGDCVVGWYMERRLPSCWGAWRAGAHVPLPQAGWRGNPRLPDSQAWSVCWVAPSHESVASILSAKGLGPSPHCPLTPLVSFSASVKTNHHSPANPTVPLRKATMTMLSSPVKSSIFRKQPRDSPAHILTLPTLCYFCQIYLWIQY